MADLTATSPFGGQLPLTIGSVSVHEESLGALTLIAPYRSREQEVSQTLEKAHGMAFPKPNRSTGKAEARAIWFGLSQAMLAGPAPASDLAQDAALTDQSDAWAAVRLQGDGAEAVLARLVPVDLRRDAFKRGHTVRSLLFHMPASITRVGDNAFVILVFRSMAQTLVHDLKRAMEGVAARG